MYLVGAICLFLLRQLKMREIEELEAKAEKMPAYTTGRWSIPFTNGKYGLHRI
jgi:hypothetical protein